MNDQNSMTALFRQLTEDTALLARKEINLAKAELKDGVEDVKVAAGSALLAAVVGMAGLGVTLMGLAYLLAESMDIWLATLIVGLLTLLIAGVLAGIARSKASVSNLSPDRTVRTIKSHTAAAQQKINEET